MKRKLRITENQVLSIIESVLNENRKVIKVGGGAPIPPAMPQGAQLPDETQGMMGDPSMGDPSMAMDDPSMGAENGYDENQFDTNFDAGVEADEETDPKRYIQQLTGKLSQSLNSFNSEQGPDAGLSKYVASMIIAAACKNLDEKAKKELIEKINTASSDEEDIPAGDGDGMEGDGSEMPQDDSMDMGNEEQVPPVNETYYTKKSLMELVGVCANTNSRPREENRKRVDREIPKAWRGKSQINGSKK